MFRCLFCSCVAWLLTTVAFSQKAPDNLTKGTDFLLVEEFRPAYFYLRQAQNAPPRKNSLEDGRFALAELFLLQNQFDSTAQFFDQSKKQSSNVAVRFLSSLRAFQLADFEMADNEFTKLSNDVPRQQSILLGKIHYYQGVIQFKKRSAQSIPLAIQHLQKSIQYFKVDSLRTYIKLAMARLQLADAYRVANEPSQALAQSKLSLHIFVSSPYSKPQYLANVYGVDGKIYYSLGKPIKAKELFDKSLQLQLTSNADSASIGATYANLGLCYDDLSDYANCEKSYERVYAYWQSLKNQPDRLVTFANNYALFLHDAVQESATAIHTLEKILPIVEARKVQSSFSIYQTYYNLATIYYDLEDYPSTKKYLSLLDDFTSKNPKDLNAATLLRIEQLRAMWMRKENKFSEALDVCQSLNAELDSIELKANDRASFYTAYADMLMSADSFKLTNTFLRKALAIYKEKENSSKQIEIANLLAINFFQLNSYDSAYRYAMLALEQNALRVPGLIYPYKNPHQAIQACYIVIASLLKEFEHQPDRRLLEKSIPFEQLGLDLIKSVRKNLYSDADRIRYNQNVTKFYEALALLEWQRWNAKQQEASNKFFEYAEESKFQALANSLSVNRVNSFKEINASLLTEERLLAKQKNLENTRLVQLLTATSETDDFSASTQQSQEQLHKLETTHARFLDSLRTNFAGYYELKYGGQSLSLSKFQNELTTTQLVLQLKVLDSVIVIQAITKKSSVLFKIPNSEKIGSQLKKLRNQINFKMESEFIDLSYQVYHQLIAPVLARLAKTDFKCELITIIPDQYFYSFPFEALVVQREPLRYLIQEYEIAYAYSCNLLIQSKRSEAPYASTTFLGVAPDFGAQEYLSGGRSTSVELSAAVQYDDFGFQPLAENKNEIDLIENLTGKSADNLLLSGDGANEQQIKKLNLSRYRYIHFATHGFIDHNLSGLSGLALTNSGEREDNVLYSSEIYNLTMRADLVCLSACETGLGQNALGEGLIGLGRAFFYSGARNLLVSLWKVPDKSTSLFMVDFYKTLLPSKSRTSASLRQAKLSMLKNPLYQNPYYWAPFILIGGN